MIKRKNPSERLLHTLLSSVFVLEAHGKTFARVFILEMYL